MPVTTCPQCRFEFLSDDDPARPRTCPSCGRQVADGLPAGAGEAVPGRQLRSAGRAVLILGLLLDALLLAGNLAFMIAWARRAGLTPRDLVGSLGLALAALAHAALSVLAMSRLYRQPAGAVLLNRLAVGCWLLFGGAAVLLGARLWPIGLPPPYVVAASLVMLGLLLTYLGACESLYRQAARRQDTT